MSHLKRFSWLPRVLGSMAVILACLAAAPDVLAQVDGKSYEKIPVDQQVRRASKPLVANMLFNGFKPGDDVKFDEYYQKAVFPEWTDPASWSEQRNPRQAILGNFRTAKRGPVYDRLNGLVMQKMVEFANGNFHPVVRYNAMLLIGELNESEAQGFGQSAKPLAKALPVLIQAYENPETPDAVRLAALLGIIQHYQSGTTDADSRQKIGSLLLALATARDAPQGRSKEGHAWLRRMAIDSLGAVGSPGEQGIVAKSIAAILSESDTPVSVRCEAALALGRLKMTADTGLDTVAVTKALDQLAIDVCEEEIARCNEDKERKVNVTKVKAGLLPIRMALTGSEKRQDRPPYRGVMGLAAEPDANKTAIKIRDEIERLIDKKILDRDELAPKDEKEKKPESGPQNFFGMGGIEMGGGMEMGMGPGGTVDPVQAASDDVLKELAAAVELFKKILAGG